ncbi:MAG: glycosyltransferase family 2 protein [Pseudomonadales bacterium]|nr:glycosyltransferase family 2 protein [Pseudomonadales bacterium]
MRTPKLAILLSTYNGEKYLTAQLDSLFDQTMQEFVLVVRDDGSSDGTTAILDEYCKRYPERIHLAPGGDTNLGASGSFSCLMEYVLQHKEELCLENSYMMFCDQDDVWQNNKLELQWQAMKECEKQFQGKPILVHSDLAVVSEDGELIAESMAHYQGLELERSSFHNMAVSNLVTGCTAFANEELVRAALPISRDAMMHDWWLALVAAAFGYVYFIPQRLVDYRQHGENVVGAKQRTDRDLRKSSVWKRLISAKPVKHFSDVARQARAFRKRFAEQLGLIDSIKLRIIGRLDVQVGLLQRLFFRLARRF